MTPAGRLVAGAFISIFAGIGALLVLAAIGLNNYPEADRADLPTWFTAAQLLGATLLVGGIVALVIGLWWLARTPPKEAHR